MILAINKAQQTHDLLESGGVFSLNYVLDSLKRPGSGQAVSQRVRGALQGTLAGRGTNNRKPGADPLERQGIFESLLERLAPRVG